MYVNLEGRIQHAFKASYPPGNAREDWLILKDLANMMKKPLGFNSSYQIRELINDYFNSKIAKT